MRTITKPTTCLIAATLLSLGPDEGRSANVALELMLLVDSSGSITLDEWEFQRDSIAGAFRDPTVNSLFSGRNNVAVSLFYWAGDAGGGLGVHEQGVGWTEIASTTDALAFADLIETTTRPDISTQPRAQTAISRAINQSIPLFADNGFEGTRQVIDVSGDGSENLDTAEPWNTSPFPTVPVDLTSEGFGVVDVPIGPVFRWGSAQDARDAALAAGIGLNGLVILSGLTTDASQVTDIFGAPTYTFDPPCDNCQSIIDAEVAAYLAANHAGQAVLELFYENMIIGAPAGDPDALLFVADDNSDFANAITAKLRAEIIPEPGPVGLLLVAFVAGLVHRRRSSLQKG